MAVPFSNAHTASSIRVHLYFLSFGSFKSGKRRAPLKNTFTSRTYLFPAKYRQHKFYLAQRNCRWFVSFVLRGKTQAIRCSSGRFSHRFSCASIIFFCVFVDAVIFVVVVAGSKLIFKWFNQCNGSSFKSKIILSLQRQISCPYLSFFFCMHTNTHMPV